MLRSHRRGEWGKERSKPLSRVREENGLSGLESVHDTEVEQRQRSGGNRERVERERRRA